MKRSPESARSTGDGFGAGGGIVVGPSTVRARPPRRGRPGRAPGARPATPPRIGAGEPEVEHANAPVGADHDVRRLEVAVDEPGAVGGRQALAGVRQHREHLGTRAPGLGQPCRQG